MRSFKLLPLVLVAAVMAATFASAASAAEWKREGTPLEDTAQWFQNGQPLTKSGTLTIGGGFSWKGPGNYGGVECWSNTNLTLNPGSTGTLNSMTFTAPYCFITGGAGSVLGSSCTKVASATSIGLSVPISTDKSRTIKTEPIGINYKLEGNASCPKDLYLGGNLVITPSNSSFMSHVGFSGSSMLIIVNGETIGSAVFPTGATGIASPTSYGIGIQDDVALSGTLSWVNGEGSIVCPFTGATVLQIGGTGQLAMSWPSACTTGGGKSGLTVTVTSTSPWSFTNEGSTIKIGNVDFTLNYKGGGSERFTGSLTATPDKSSAISSTSLSGTLQRTGGNTSWTGSASWSPAGVFGL